MKEYIKFKKPNKISEYEKLLRDNEYKWLHYSHKEYWYLWFWKKLIILDNDEVYVWEIHKKENSNYKYTEAWLRKKQSLKKYLPNHCERCWWKENLQIHHNNYRKKPWNEKIVDVNRLCEKCHTEFHYLYWTDKVDYTMETWEFIKTYKKYIQENI